MNDFAFCELWESATKTKTKISKLLEVYRTNRTELDLRYLSLTHRRDVRVF
jgi:hypothetical protein